MRVLQAVFDGGGNVPPQILIAKRLVERGHDVRVIGHRVQRPRFEAVGAEFAPYELAPDADASRPETDILRDWEARTPIGAAANIRDNLMYGPALLFARDVIAEVERHRPDVATIDFLVQGAITGAEAARVPHAVLVHIVWPIPTPGVPPFGMGLRPMGGPAGRLRDGFFRWLFESSYGPGLKSLNSARRELGLEPLDYFMGQLQRADRTLVLTAREFDFAGEAELPGNVRYVGPVIDSLEDGDWDSPWPRDDPEPLVVASFSTTFQDQRDLARHVLEALGALPVRGLLTTGPAIDVTGLPIPSNVVVREYVPHAAVFPEADLVIGHGGLGTVHMALAAGIPQICLPHGRDQEDTAARVVHADAGVKLSRRASAAKLRRTISEALADHRLKAGAARIATAFALYDGAGAVAEELEALAAR